MGSFFSPGKNEFYWAFLDSLADESIYAKDSRVIPNTPDYLQTYTDLFPTVLPGVTLYIFINGTLVGSGFVDPMGSGLFYAAIPTPNGEFVLEVRNQAGDVLTTDLFMAKNYAMFFDVSAQSYEDRRVAVEQTRNDINYQTIRTGGIYDNLGVFFLPPSPRLE